eukprot:NODE_3367_length_981_cov_19.275176_g3221_i0.p1 GENE.NODE_3367_length_981_cov_19.275176_g3221_i0~~NODE_3367_length_981_cov_19.275176_g3221_i0.p1  ORF type:complete len:271 (-),score=100.78 NODE_3367_length_981_cov_19.275176_g3221_i0:167-913(-)
MYQHDPYTEVKEDLMISLGELEAAYIKWQKLQKDGETPELEKLRAKLLETIRTIEVDLTGLSDANRAVLTTRKKFSITDTEIAARQQFVSETKAKLTTIKSELLDPAQKAALQTARRAQLTTQPAPAKPTSSHTQDYTLLPDDTSDFIDRQLQQQQAIEMEHDVHLEDLSHAVKRLKVSGKDISSELKVQDRMLTSLDDEMNTLQSKLKSASKRVERLLLESDDKGKMGCIGVLVVLLVIVVVLFFMI